MLVDGQKSGPRIHPRSGVVILNAVAHHRKRGVRVSAKYALALPVVCIAEGSARDLVRKPQPPRTHPVEKSREAFGLRIELLNLVKQVLAHPADQQVLADEAIELMPVHRQVTLALVLPHVALIDRHADQVGHQVGQPVVVVALHPDNFNTALGIGELTNVRKKPPMLAGKPAKIQVRKNISQQDQPAKAVRLQYIQGILCTAHLRAQVDVRQDQRVVANVAHTS
jgi:hypothetical protein